MHSHLAGGETLPASRIASATRTVTIRILARANEIANTQIAFGINELRIRRFFPFVTPSLFRRIFGNLAIATLQTPSI